MQKPGYEFLPHTTDAYIEARGATIGQALAFAGLALFDTMCNVKTVSQDLMEEIAVEGRDEVGLLYDWLESLLLKFDLEGMVYSKFEIGPITKSEDALKTNVRVWGQKYDRAKHGAKVEVKAVTYHKMEIERQDSNVAVRFILDL